jgi:hypothetical protein
MYNRAWRVIMGICSLGLATGIFTNISYRILNRRAAKKEAEEGVEVRRYYL